MNNACLTLCLTAGLCVACPTLVLGQTIDVSSDGNTVSVSANGAPIGTLAQSLSDATGIAFIVTGDPESRIDVQLTDEPLSTAVTLLTPNHMVVRKTSDPASPIVEVVLMVDGSGSSGTSSQFLPSGDPADTVVSGHDNAEQPALPGAEAAPVPDASGSLPPLDQESYDQQQLELQQYQQPNGNPDGEPRLEPAQPADNAEILINSLPPPPNPGFNDGYDIGPPNAEFDGDMIGPPPAR